jgi:hypothetical protein
MWRCRAAPVSASTGTHGFSAGPAASPGWQVGNTVPPWGARAGNGLGQAEALIELADGEQPGVAGELAR